VSQDVAERRPTQELGDEERTASLDADVVDDEDVGVIQRAGSDRFLVEPPLAVGIALDVRRQARHRRLQPHLCMMNA
jgi:hypothetical protein